MRAARDNLTAFRAEKCLNQACGKGCISGGEGGGVWRRGGMVGGESEVPVELRQDREGGGGERERLQCPEDAEGER